MPPHVSVHAPDCFDMNKDGYVKIGAALFALLVFSRTGSAATNSQQALVEVRKTNAKLTALEEQMNGGASGATGADGESAASTEKSTTTEAAKKSGETGVGAARTSGSGGSGATGGHGSGATGAIHWSYAGDGAPSKWSSLDPANVKCASGTAQSPIDLAHAAKSNLPDPVFNDAAVAGTIVDNGHTVLVNVAAGDTFTTNGDTYTLVQFDFHAPSEHTVAGKSFPVEVQLVHKDSGGKLAVVSLLVSQGDDNPAFDSVIANLPIALDTPKAISTPIEPEKMLPAVQATYRYSGSLTTPPCTEGVDWNVMAQPITMSKTQIDAIVGALHEPNNRPIQPLGARPLVLDSNVELH